MKRHAFYMSLMAVALMGGQSFATEYRVSEHNGEDLTLGDGDTLIVDCYDDISELHNLTTRGSCTLDFSGAMILYVSGDVDLSQSQINFIWSKEYEQYFCENVSTINGKWKVPAIIAEYRDSITMSNSTITIKGIGAGGTVEFLCDPGVVYSTETVYASFVGEISRLQDLNDGEIGYVSPPTGNALVFHGKNFSEISPTPTTPEPATATLSLLALAGLAYRRRK